MNPALKDLTAMSRADLVKAWETRFGHPAPLKAREEILRQTLAWQIQEQAHGGLRMEDKRRLKRSNASTPLTTGSQLIRVWQDQTYQVTVLADGFQFQGKHWKSLSAIAKAITGTPWSGPVFFGLK